MDTLLAIDCSDQACSVALLHRGEVTEVFHDQQRQHARHIMAMLDDCLAQAGVGKTDLDGLYWCHGPGSFTGLRIAAATVQGLAFGLDLPVRSVSSLFAMALRAPAQPAAADIWVALDARMGEVYWSLFRRDEAGILERLEPDHLTPVTALKVPRQVDLGIGSALAMEGLSIPEAMFVEVQTQIHAGDLLRLPRDSTELFAGSAFDVEPAYLRREDAWQKQERH